MVGVILYQEFEMDIHENMKLDAIQKLNGVAPRITDLQPTSSIALSGERNETNLG